MNDPAFNPNPVPTKQRANVYTVMLIVSFLCLSIGCIFMLMEARQYAGTSNAMSPWKIPAELKPQ